MFFQANTRVAGAIIFNGCLSLQVNYHNEECISVIRNDGAFLVVSQMYDINKAFQRRVCYNIVI